MSYREGLCADTSGLPLTAQVRCGRVPARPQHAASVMGKGIKGA